ncbi:tRNA (guanosine(37)-N1)-methyltransferase TrmD [Candidatus Parcubacteria bacterium]|nr:tRNA (guanosine(37)-N1)-methyltransferase TrmD [Candidatus Parcubacteria bacterium]
MRFDIVTIFPHILDSYLSESILKRAREKKLLDIRIHNLRGYTTDKHKTVDDRPYGGGPGMVMQIEPVAKAVQFTKSKIKNQKSKIVLTSARGKQFTQAMARGWAKKCGQLIIICGRYEGVDERVKAILKAEEVSIGPYVLAGGELPAMVIVEAVSRHIPGVLGTYESLEEIKGSYPVYTRPEVFTVGKKKLRVPKVLLSGDHAAIAAWRSRRMRRA